MSSSQRVTRTSDIEEALGRYRARIESALRETVEQAAETTPRSPESATLLATLYGQIEYHLGWRDEHLQPAQSHPGKLMRPALVLLAAELAGGAEAVTRALPVAAVIELIHNFSLIHDDIEDGDESRRGRPTLWKVWGQAQAINSGDALFSLARMRVLRMAQDGVDPALVARLGLLIDVACLELCEGQHLDMSFEGRREVTEAMYLDMIGRKTAALMSCAAEAGGRAGAPSDDTLAGRLGAFGRALGLGFQLRDDVLGAWSARELGKTEGGDLRRKKMTLPVIHALAHAALEDHAALDAIYAEPGPASEEQVAQALAILDKTGARNRAYSALREQLETAATALEDARRLAGARHVDVGEAGAALASLIAFIRADADD